MGDIEVEEDVTTPLIPVEPSMPVTPYSDVYEAFLDRILRDTSFFLQKEPLDSTKPIAEVRMGKLLQSAVYELMLSDGYKNCEINFLKQMDNNNDTFLMELNLVEIQLFADLMFQAYVQEEIIVRIESLKRVGFQDSEIKIVINSPANSLKEYNISFEKLQKDNLRKIKNYKNRSRDTLEYIPFDFGLEG